MLKIFSSIKWLALLAITVLAIIIILTLKNSPKAPDAKMSRTLISELIPVIELCNLEIVEDIPIKGHIGSKHIFARVTLNGNISFDLDNLETHMSCDTLVIMLPREKVEVKESTAPGSYEVIDTWNEKLFGSDTFSTLEENEIKRLVAQNFKKRIYAKGYVKRARAEAVESIRDMMSYMLKTPVKVIDPSPSGNIKG